MWLRRISWGDGRLGPMGVEQSVWRIWLMDIPDDLAVVSEVLMVLTCHSIRPPDLG